MNKQIKRIHEIFSCPEVVPLKILINFCFPHDDNKNNNDLKEKTELPSVGFGDD